MFGLRLGGNMFTFSTDRGISGVDYNLDVKLRSFGAVLDLYPVAGTGFRISGGARINYNKADLTGTLSGPRSFGGVVVTPQQAGQLDGEAKFDRFAPMPASATTARCSAPTSASAWISACCSRASRGSA